MQLITAWYFQQTAVHFLQSPRYKKVFNINPHSSQISRLIVQLNLDMQQNATVLYVRITRNETSELEWYNFNY